MFECISCFRSILTHRLPVLIFKEKHYITEYAVPVFVLSVIRSVPGANLLTFLCAAHRIIRYVRWILEKILQQVQTDFIMVFA